MHGGKKPALSDSTSPKNSIASRSYENHLIAKTSRPFSLAHFSLLGATAIITLASALVAVSLSAGLYLLVFRSLPVAVPFIAATVTVIVGVPVIGCGLRTIRELASSRRDLKRLTEELSIARDAAEQGSRAKSTFLANMSHELRTPLNAIIGFSEVIRDAMLEPVGERYRDYARDIHASGQHLLRVINDILDLAKIESGRVELDEEEVDIAVLVATCLPIVEQRVKATRIDLRTLVPSGLLVWADELRLKQVILNLLSNAAKFTPPGGTVTVSAVHAVDGSIMITVTDTGIGMRPEDISVAMEAFQQVDGGLSRRDEGTGLGLPLARQLAELHGGGLTIESQIRKGTTVRVRLPAERVIHAQPSA